MNEAHQNSTAVFGEKTPKNHEISESIKFVVPYWTTKLRLTPYELFTMPDDELNERIRVFSKKGYSQKESNLLNQYHNHKELKELQARKIPQHRQRLRAGGNDEHREEFQQTVAKTAHKIETSYCDNSSTAGAEMHKNSFLGPEKSYIEIGDDIDYVQDVDARQQSRRPYMNLNFTVEDPNEQIGDQQYNETLTYKTTSYGSIGAKRYETPTPSQINFVEKARTLSPTVSMAAKPNEKAKVIRMVQSLRKERDQLKALYSDSIRRLDAAYNSNLLLDMNPSDLDHVTGNEPPGSCSKNKIAEVIAVCKMLKDAKETIKADSPAGGDLVIQRIVQRAAFELNNLYVHCKCRLNVWLMNHPLWNGLLDELSKDVDADLAPIAKVLQSNN